MNFIFLLQLLLRNLITSHPFPSPLPLPLPVSFFLSPSISFPPLHPPFLSPSLSLSSFLSYVPPSFPPSPPSVTFSPLRLLAISRLFQHFNFQKLNLPSLSPAYFELIHIVLDSCWKYLTCLHGCYKRVNL